MEKIINTAAFQNSLYDHKEVKEAIDKKRDELKVADKDKKTKLEIELAELHSIALADYLRPIHATPEQYRRVIQRICIALGDENIFSIRDVSFENELIDICVSHNLDATVLSEMYSAHRERFSRRLVVADHVANTQFIAAMLRLADILDCDFERTPRILFDNLGVKDIELPDAEISIREWQRHLAVQQIEIGEDELILRATCHHPAIESTVNHFGIHIEKEIRDTLAILKRNPNEVLDNYQLCIPPTVRCEIRSLDYIYMELKLQLDERAVTGLLMGTRLYHSKFEAIRELVQNSIDACSVRKYFENTDVYHPCVEIFEFRENDGTVWLQVRDNGIGMTEDVLRNHFFRVGSSYYSSAGFDRLLRAQKVKNIPLIARFGIGFLSVFMLGDSVKVETRRMDLPGSDSVGWRVFVQQHGALAFVQIDNSISRGTTISVKLGKESELTDIVLDRILGYLRHNLIRPTIETSVKLKDEVVTLRNAGFASLRKIEELDTNAKAVLENVVIIQIDVAKYTDKFSGVIFLALAKISGSDKLDCYLNDKRMEFSEENDTPDKIRLNPKWFFSGFSGNRVTVSGFRMVLKHLNRLLRKNKNFVPAIYDLDFVPNKFVDFDVTRTNIRDESMSLRSEIRRVVVEGLKEMGILDASSLFTVGKQFHLRQVEV